MKKILRRIYLFLLKPWLPKEAVICDGPGYRIKVRPPRTSVIGRSIYLHGIWEKEVTNIAQEKIKKGWNILDIGADVGYYSLLFASKCGPKGKVAAFEPDPEAIPYLNDNISMFEYSNIDMYDFALSDHVGHGMMKQGGRGQLYPNEEASDEKSNTVKMTTLDKVFPKFNLEKLDLVKMDVEGAEISILKGMDKTIKKYHPHLLIEIHPRQLKEVFNSSAEEVIDILTNKYSYKLTPIDSKTLDIPKNGNITVWADWID